jgi:hypothetical protein
MTDRQKQEGDFSSGFAEIKNGDPGTLPGSSW